MTDILDIEGIIVTPLVSVLTIGLGALIFITALVLTLLGWRIWRRYRNRRKDLPPWDRALLEMERLDKQGLTATGQAQKFYFFLSEITRRYLEERFGYPASEKTTPEILADLNSLEEFEGQQRMSLKGFLERADLVKFARLTRRPEEMLQDLEAMKNLVCQTRPAGGAS